MIGLLALVTVIYDVRNLLDYRVFPFGPRFSRVARSESTEKFVVEACHVPGKLLPACIRHFE